MSNTKEVTIFCTVREDKVHTIALSREDALKSLIDYWGYSDEDRDLWSVKSVRRIVPVVLGTIVDPESDHHHVLWTCPLCREEHHVDVDSGESGPSIWYCDYACDIDKVVLVEWQRMDLK